MIVVADDEDRENEGDLIMAAEKVTPEAINFMVTHGRGLICLAITGERADDLELTPMVPHNTSACGTAFTVSIDATGHGVTTGVSAMIEQRQFWPQSIPERVPLNWPDLDTFFRFAHTYTEF